MADCKFDVAFVLVQINLRSEESPGRARCSTVKGVKGNYRVEVPSDNKASRRSVRSGSRSLRGISGSGILDRCYREVAHCEIGGVLRRSE